MEREYFEKHLENITKILKENGYESSFSWPLKIFAIHDVIHVDFQIEIPLGNNQDEQKQE
jgi:hypothetical protein